MIQTGKVQTSGLKPYSQVETSLAGVDFEGHDVRIEEWHLFGDKVDLLKEAGAVIVYREQNHWRIEDKNDETLAKAVTLQEAIEDCLEAA